MLCGCDCGYMIVNVNDETWMNNQWKGYMSHYTTLSLDEAYQIYLKQRPSKEDKKMFEEMYKVNPCPSYGGHNSNPYIFRFIHPNNQKN